MPVQNDPEYENWKSLHSLKLELPGHAWSHCIKAQWHKVLFDYLYHTESKEKKRGLAPLAYIKLLPGGEAA